MMTVADTSRIDKEIQIRATPERVWRALTSPDELSAWFRVTIEGELVPGSEVWMVSQHENYVGQRFRVRVVEMTRPSRVVWEWHPGEIDPSVDYTKEPRTTVTFTLEPTPGGTRLRVSETGFDFISLARRAKVHADNDQGWMEVIVWLQTHAEASN